MLNWFEKNAPIRVKFRALLVKDVQELERLKKKLGIERGVLVGEVTRIGIEVDPQTYFVRADGELLVCEPATELPMAQRYFLF
mgnify:CR=1 FL=1